MPAFARLSKLARDVAVRVLPKGTRDAIRAFQRRHKLQAVPVGTVDFGSLRRLDPISPIFGLDRDLISVERWYIEKFLDTHRADVRGRVLEMGDPAYTLKFGDGRVTRSDVLNYVEGNPKATIVGDLTNADIVTERCFWVGIYPGLTEDHLEYTAKTIRDFVASASR